MRSFRSFFSTLFLILACVQDQGIISPDNSDNLIPLATFGGRTINEGDTAIGANRLMRLANPNIALMWQFLGVTRFMYTVEGSSVQTRAPYTFSGKLLLPPPSEIYTSSEVALGTFVLYSDVNQNGMMDNAVHPSLQKAYTDIDRLNQHYRLCLDSLYGVSVKMENYVDSKDRFYVDFNYTIIHENNGRKDTIWYGDTISHVNLRGILKTWCKVLANENKWDAFFSIRKRVPFDYFADYTDPDFKTVTEYAYKRILFPVTGKELLFKKRLIDVLHALVALTIKSDAVMMQAYTEGWINYPFDNFFEQNQDWMAGRCTWYHVLYLPDQKSLDELLEAEARSSFVVQGKSNLHPGYNLITSDNQYRCRVLSWADSIIIELGENELHFNHPSKLELPIEQFQEKEITESAMIDLEGVYEYRPFKPAVIVYADSSLWLHVPDLGLTRLVPADSSTYYSPACDIQIDAVIIDGVFEKIFLYYNHERIVLIPGDGPEELIQEKKQTVSNILCTPVNTSLDSTHNSIAGCYAFQEDTISVTNKTDSILANLPGMCPQAFFSVNDSLFVTFNSDLQLLFTTDSLGKVGVIVNRGGSSRFFSAVSIPPSDNDSSSGSSSAAAQQRAKEFYISTSISDVNR